MKKVIFQNAVSVDGYFEGPNHELDWHNVDQEFNDYADQFLSTIGTIVFGRVTYEMMASYWPTAGEEDPIIAHWMNTLPKVVFLRTLEKVDWENTRLVKENAHEELARLKEQPGKDIVIFGSSDLALTFMHWGLIDEFRILVMPVILGSGKLLFSGIYGRYPLKLLRTKPFKSGNVMLVYEENKKK